jgi:hypothetical protein
MQKKKSVLRNLILWSVVSSRLNFRANSFLISALAVCASLLLTSCGGSSNTATKVTTATTSISSAVAGEVVDLTVDLTTMTYSWNTLVSAYSPSNEEASGSGTLIGPNNLGRYTLIDSKEILVTNLVLGRKYAIASVGTTDFTSGIGAINNLVGTIFTARNVGSGTGTVHLLAGSYFMDADGSKSVARLALPVLNDTNRAFANNTGLTFGLEGDFPNLVTVPVLALATPLTTTSAIAGLYNFISLTCAQPSRGFFMRTPSAIWNENINLAPDALCSTDFGTVQIASDGTFKACSKGNLATASCGGTSVNGSVNLVANRSYWNISEGTGGAAGTHTAAFQNTAAGKVGWIDTNGGSLGYGQITLSEQIALTGATRSGIYGTYKSDTSGFNSSEHTVCTVIGQDNKVLVDSQVQFTVDLPWAGFIVPSSLEGNVNYPSLAMAAGNGAYASRNAVRSNGKPEPWGFEIGLRYTSNGCQ